MATAHSEDRSSPLLTVTHGNNALDPSLDLMGGVDGETMPLMMDGDASTTGILSPTAIRQLALQTPNPPLDPDQAIEDGLMFDQSLLDGDGTAARVLNFDEAEEKAIDLKDALVDSAILEDFGASQETDVGEYGLAEAFDIGSSDSPPPSDLVSWRVSL